VAAPEVPEIIMSDRPDRMVMTIPGLRRAKAKAMAEYATQQAKLLMPKMSGGAASRMTPLYGDGFFGVAFQDSYVWFQENGIRPFTMNNLQGKVIPMWIDDPTGVERQKNPKAKTRQTLSGKTQVLIFRKAAVKGTTVTKRTKDKATGQMVTTVRPASYPGAPGRIGVREAAGSMTTMGRTGGRIAKGNIGVKWRHPGLKPRLFLNNAMSLASQKGGYLPVRIYVADARSNIEVR
jgi:hypothetical protein